MNVSKALRCALLAKEVYHDFADELFQFSDFAEAEFGLVQDEQTDTQSAWIHDQDDSRLYLIFRGTEKNIDWKTNVTFSRDLFQILDTDKVSADTLEQNSAVEDAQMTFDSPGDLDLPHGPNDGAEEDVIDDFGEAPALASNTASEEEGMQIVPVLDNERASALGNRETGTPRDLAPDAPRAQMHLGFVRAYMTVQDRIHAAVDKANPKQLTITGHSLGGALATLAAIDFTLTEPGRFEIDLFTFGSPRVGNKEFQALFDKYVPHAYRVVNGLDIIPTLPRIWQGYHHVGKEVRIGSRWSWRFLSRRVSDHFMLHYIPSLEAMIEN